MYQIIAHVKPTKKSEHYGKCGGAYAVIFIDYKEIEGAFLLARHYIDSEDWEILEMEETCYSIEKPADMGEEYEKYFDEVKTYGFSLIFNIYDDE